MATPGGCFPLDVTIFDTDFVEVNEVVPNLLGQVQLPAELRRNLIALIPVYHRTGFISENISDGLFEVLKILQFAEIFISTEIFGRILGLILWIISVIEKLIFAFLEISLVLQFVCVFESHELVFLTDISILLLFFNPSEVSLIFVLLYVILLPFIIVQNLLLFRSQRLSEQTWWEHLDLTTH